ncbi:MAG: IPT/TIG domain-containing protein [Desulfosarcinaceae bacterium]
MFPLIFIIAWLSLFFTPSASHAASRGDINKDGAVDLTDAVVCLQVLSQSTPSGLPLGDYDALATDVNGDSRIGIAEAFYALCCAGGIRNPENSPVVTISGPDGSTLTVPAGALNGGATIVLTEAGDTTGLVDDGETLVSPALTLSTVSDAGLFGDGVFSLSIPVDPSKVSQPDKLLLKVRLTSGESYWILGVYDDDAGVYRADLSGVVDGWQIAVVEDPSIQIVRASFRENPSAGALRSPSGWLTDLDWKSYEWVVVNHTIMSEEDIKSEILPELWSASETLATAGFRAPKIYLDPRQSPPARICHLIGGQEADGSHFHAGYILYENGTWTYTEDQTTFSDEFLDDEQLSALGQMYVNYDQFVDLNAKYGVSLGNIVIHELFHAVQYGYDVRKLQISLAAYLEGTATPLGQTYQDAAGSITGPNLSVRVLRPNEHARLYQAVDDPTNPLYYTKQDFFTYVSKRYGGNSFAWTDQLFEYMNTWTAGKFGLTTAQYRELYRKATDEVFSDMFQKGLSQVFREYALDRAYEHSPDSVLRPAEETAANGFAPYHLAKTLFQWDENDTDGLKKFEPKTNPSIQFAKIEPLSCHAVTLALPGQADPAAPADFPLLLKLEDGEILPGEGGVKIYAFIEDADGDMLAGGDIEIKDVSQPVMIPYMPDAAHLTVLILNSYIENKNVKVTVSAGPYIESVAPNPAEWGDAVTVQGVSFGADQGDSTLHLGDAAITDITSWSNSRIVFNVPNESTSGKIKVVVNGAETNEVELEVIEPEPPGFDFVQSWSVQHGAGSWGTEPLQPDTIDFTATVSGKVLNAINPSIKLKNFNVDNAKIVEISNMKQNEPVTVQGTIVMALSASTVAPTNPSRRSFYEYYPNPRLSVYRDGVLVATSPDLNFSWTFDSEGYFYDLDLYVEYDCYEEAWKYVQSIIDPEDSSWILESMGTYTTKVFHLRFDILKDVPNWGTP